MDSTLNFVVYSLEVWTSNLSNILAKIRLSLHRNKTVKSLLYDWSKIDIRNQYTVTIINKKDTFHETPEKPTPNEEYKNFVTAHIEAAAGYISIKPRAKCRVPL